MKEIKNKNTGITLIALVITIIILLILAGISIVTLTGSGLFENARLAEQKSKNAQDLEDTTLNDYENKIGEYVDGLREDINKKDLQTYTEDTTGKLSETEYYEVNCGFMPETIIYYFLDFAVSDALYVFEVDCVNNKTYITYVNNQVNKIAYRTDFSESTPVVLPSNWLKETENGFAIKAPNTIYQNSKSKFYAFSKNIL